MYSREEVKAITDRVMNMAKADAVEVEFSGGERSATRFANSNITANMVQFDRSLAITAHVGVVQTEVRDPLTDQILFGALEQGGTVTISVADGALAFRYEARRVPAAESSS